MISNFILAPIFVHMLTAIVLLFFWKNVRAQKTISVIGNVIGFFISWRLFALIWENGNITMQMGGWQAPFGITFVGDTLSATMVMLTAIVSLAS